MDEAALLAHWRDEHQRPVSGWDFSELAGRHLEQHPPWSYDDLARVVLRGRERALDMGTGGGEVLRRLADALPPETVATEGWPPNLPVATEALAPLGVGVVAYDAEQDRAMPFPDGHFDVVLNRHEAYDAGEVLRVLRPGGVFLTQQVDGRDFEETQALFGGQTAYPHVTYEQFRAGAEAAGFEVEDGGAWTGRATFTDVAAFVRYAAHVPWEVPEDFAVDRYPAQLLALHRQVEAGRPLEFTQRRFWLRCRHPS